MTADSGGICLESQHWRGRDRRMASSLRWTWATSKTLSLSVFVWTRAYVCVCVCMTEKRNNWVFHTIYYATLHCLGHYLKRDQFGTYNCTHLYGRDAFVLLRYTLTWKALVKQTTHSFSFQCFTHILTFYLGYKNLCCSGWPLGNLSSCDFLS